MSDNEIYIKDPSIREGFIKVKMYRIFSAIFLVVGFLIFLLLYNGFMEGRPMRDMLSFAMVFIIILPFLPATALSWIAMKTEKATEEALKEYIEEEERKKEEKIKEEKARREELARKRAEAEGVEYVEEGAEAPAEEEPAPEEKSG